MIATMDNSALDISTRQITQIINGQSVTDGQGVKLKRFIGTSRMLNLDPFLLFDVMASDQPQDYMGGFPSHPHRGFETVTYLFAGKMRHRDSNGNEGVVEPEGVQWMTAGSGIVHSEIPEQVEGLLHGIQLWINLPKSAKMIAPAYQDFHPDNIPEQRLATGGKIRVIAGQTDQGTTGAINNPFTLPLFMDAHLGDGERFSQYLPQTHSAFIYVLTGQLITGEPQQLIESGQLALLSQGTQIKVQANHDTRFLLVAGRPINEPIVRGGPFVMNSKAELLQAFEDFQNNRF